MFDSEFVKSISALFSSGNIPGEILVLILFVGCILLMIFGITKLVTQLKDVFGNAKEIVSKSDLQEVLRKLNEIVTDIRERTEDINDNVDKTSESIKKLVEDHGHNGVSETRLVGNNVTAILKVVQENVIVLSNVQKTVEVLSNDIDRLRDLHIGDRHIIAPIKSNIDNLIMQINGIQRDLAALQGTIIGLTSQRSGLK